MACVCSTYVEDFSKIIYHKSHLLAPLLWRCFLLNQRFIAKCFVCSTYVEILFLLRHLESDDQLHLVLPDVDFEAQMEEEGLDGLVCDIDQPELF